ncbi:NACHT, LRR and PYD domains-containing protein 14-like protein [Lates japonicus]|uniref:NACHT, LRR and PYD domains-containing protein 14-like protein n=1 Tax=Lates japonicus TaxID=270547 RepID=A0AAD3N841_LATJO|nr:NACHT, LRR and PYD domains-containing protein 14-like protein [Lates japonicus]
MKIDLKNILDDLRDEDFENFKWFLKYETVNNIPPIKERQLSKAHRGSDGAEIWINWSCGSVGESFKKYQQEQSGGAVTSHRLRNRSWNSEQGGQSSSGDRLDAKKRITGQFNSDGSSL